MVRYWLHNTCGACYYGTDVWTEAQYEEALQAVRKQMDPRLRSLPFFTPSAPMRPAEEELS